MAENADGKQRRRGPGQRFKPGQSGNPRGKTPGTRHRVTVLAERLMSDDAEDVVRRVVAAAKGGDMTAARLILDRIIPVRKGRPVSITLPNVISAVDVTAAVASVIAAMGSGTISPDEAATVCAVIEVQRRAIETAELEARLRAIEGKLATDE